MKLFFRTSTTYILLIALMCGCGEKMITDNQGVNRWIRNTVADNYLWASELPAASGSDFSIKPNQYFDNFLRYRANRDVEYKYDIFGDRYSSLALSGGTTKSADTAWDGDYMLATDTKNDFGMSFRRTTNSNGSKIKAAQIIYVVPGSPAHKIGLQRGQMINRINDLDLSTMPSVVDFEAEIKKSKISVYISGVSSPVTISRATYADNPIVFHKLLGTSPKCGYIVYNHFSAGKDSRFLKDLNSVFKTLRDGGAKELILDLRYNGGGELRTARHLASLMARDNMLGNVLIYKETKKNFSNPNYFESETFLSKADISSSNINPVRICILTSEYTASASELIIHALRAHYGGDIMVVGAKTRGKNLGTRKISNTRYYWSINLVTLRVYDKMKVSGYEQGLTPDHYASEMGEMYNIGNWGDAENELLLAAALEKMYPGQDLGSSRSSVTKYGEQKRDLSGDVSFYDRIEERELTTDHIFVD